MPTREIIKAKPRFRGNQVRVQKETHDSARIRVTVQESAYIYAVIVKDSTETPLVDQIIAGKDAENNLLTEGKSVVGLTNENGAISLDFNLLDEDSDYVVYVTAESVVPFATRSRLADSDTVSINVKTKRNMNLKRNRDNVV